MVGRFASQVVNEFQNSLNGLRSIGSQCILDYSSCYRQDNRRIDGFIQLRQLSPCTQWHCPCDGCRSDHGTCVARSKCSVWHWGSQNSIGRLVLHIWCYGSSLWMVPVLPDRPNSSLLYQLWPLWGYVDCLQCTSGISCQAAVHRLYGGYRQQRYF